MRILFKAAILALIVALVASCATYYAHAHVEGDGDVYLATNGYLYASGEGVATLTIRDTDGRSWGPFTLGAPSEPWEIGLMRQGTKLVKVDPAVAKTKAILAAGPE